MPAKRSVGVTVLGIIAIIFGGLPILGGIIISILALAKGSVSLIWTWRHNSISQTLSAYLICTIFFIVGLGILKLKNWSRILLFVLMSMNIIASLVHLSLTIGNVVSGNLSASKVIRYFVSLFICVFVIYFFTRPKVKEQFK